MGEQYLIYLRKSRQDRDLEAATGRCDTLERHREALLELAAKRGFTVTGIYEEVVSGDTIAERPEMQKLLKAVGTGEYAGVLVMEIARLARGNTSDQGIVAEAFQYSGTKIITPVRDYDPCIEADEEYFEFELFMSRREYKMINRRQQRGRIASLNEGKYIAGTAPYGYEKYKLPGRRGYSLRPVEDRAEVVRRIFREFTMDDIGCYTIANRLNTDCIPSPGGGAWSASSVRDITKNPVYAGFVRWSYRPVVKKVEDGVRSISTPVSKNPTIVKGIHEAIISEETYRTAQEITLRRSHAPVPGNRQIANPLAGLVFCSVCGHPMVQLPKGSKSGPMLKCMTPGCPTVSSLTEVVESAVLDALRLWLARYEVDFVEDGAAAGAKKLENEVKRLKTALNNLDIQRNKLYDLLEQGIYSQEVFLERSKVLAQRIDKVRQELAEKETRAGQAEEAAELQRSIIPMVRQVLEGYSTLPTAAAKNMLLKTVLERAVYSKSTGGRWAESDMKVFVFPRSSVWKENK